MLPVVAQLVEAAQFFAAKHVSRSNSARDPIMTILTIRVSIIGGQGLCSPSSPGGAGWVRRRAGAEAYPKPGEGRSLTALLRGLLCCRLHGRARTEMRHHQLADHAVLLDD